MAVAGQHASRRDFLRGGLSGPFLVRPVGAGDEIAFHDECTQCGACAKACPEHIIRRDAKGFPFLDFSKGGCTFCNECTQACEPRALLADRPWPYRAQIAQGCLAANGVTCRSCQDFCDARAIRFAPALSGQAELHLDSSACTGCGDCIAVCPVQAISLKQISTQTEVRQC